MVHLSSFEAIHYRGIDGLSLPRLSRANLVTGVNGVGKTALIEAIWLFLGRHSPSLLWNENVQRSGNPVADPVTTLSDGVLELRGTENDVPHRLRCTFEPISGVVRPAIVGTGEENGPQLRVIGRILTSLDGETAQGSTGGMHLTPKGIVVHENPASPVAISAVIESTKFQLETPDEYLRRYSEMVRAGAKPELTKAINLILPRVQGVEILADDTGESYLSTTTTDGRQLPIHDLGGGAVRLFRLLLGFFAARQGVLLMDEVENGIHYSALAKVWGHVRQWMGTWNVQVVATTHSAECIDAAVTAFLDVPEDLSIHKLFRNGSTEGVEAATFTGEALEGARDLDLEVR